MKKVLSNGNVPVKTWLDDIEGSAMEQIVNLSNLPFAFHHIAIMPDCHAGYGMPIGGVLATKNIIIPNAVGVDIGCGMCAVKTSLTELDKETLKKIMGKIREVVPVGFNHQKEKQDSNLMPPILGIDNKLHPFSPNLASVSMVEKNPYPVISREYESALTQIGTLGGGNHFIEIQKGDDGHIWIMLHSGSRNFGLKIAEHYNDLAKGLNAKWFSSVPKEFDLAFLPIESEEGQAYIREMNYAVDFAFANRKLMMDNIIDVFNEIIEAKEDLRFDPMINIAHNYASLESHFGQNVWVHRKGATLARKGTIGIIPGSQGTSSYIVEGLGNKESFESCSHGAGRKMGRKFAIENLSLEEEQKKLDDQGIVHGIRNVNDLDEASGAYKDIDTVIENESDLVKPLVKLTPLGVIKG